MPKEWLTTQVETIHDSIIKNYTRREISLREARTEIWSSLAHGNASFHKSFVTLVITLLIITISSSICWLFSDAFAQMGSFPGDSTRGLLSNISDVEPISITTNQSTGLSTYTNSEHGFEFDFPSTWEALQIMNMNPTWIEGLPTEIARIGSPAEQGIHDLVTIGMLKPEEGTYLDTEEMVVKTRNSQEHARVWTNVLQQGGVELVRENAVTVSGLPAWRIEYTGIDYNTEIFVVKEDGTMYNIKFRTPILKAPESLPIFDRIVESFRFVDSSGVQQPQTNQKTTSGSMGSELNAQPQVPNSNFLMSPLSAMLE